MLTVFRRCRHAPVGCTKSITFRDGEVRVIRLLSLCGMANVGGAAVACATHNATLHADSDLMIRWTVESTTADSPCSSRVDRITVRRVSVRPCCTQWRRSLAWCVCARARARAAHRPTIVLAQTVIARPVSAVRVDRACQRGCGCHVHVRMPRRAAGGTLRAARVAICVRGRGARSVPNFGQSPCACCCDHARRQNTDAALLHPEALPSDEYAALCEIVWPRVSSAERNRVLSVWFNQVRGPTDAVLWVWRPHHTPRLTTRHRCAIPLPLPAVLRVFGCAWRRHWVHTACQRPMRTASFHTG